MPFEKSEGKWLSMPKVGEEVDFTPLGKIKLIEKVDNPDHKLNKFNFMENKTETVFDAQGTPKEIKTQVDLGYFYRISFENSDKTLPIADWSSFYALSNAGVVEGKSFKVLHPAKGDWRIILT